ncbi:MAG: hypothetical protein JW873_06170 [Candidatus Saganbacteria bacterium]|nr:hypothetical protein [Candidatus Saganbacteria bacterium]
MNINQELYTHLSFCPLSEILKAEQYNSNNVFAAFDQLEEKYYVDKIRDLYSIANKGGDVSYLIRLQLLRLSEVNFLSSISNIFQMHYRISIFCLRNSVETALFTYKYIQGKKDAEDLDLIFIKKSEHPEQFKKTFNQSKFPETDQRIFPLKETWDLVNDWGCHINMQSVATHVKLADKILEIAFFDESLSEVINLRRIINYIINAHFNILNIHYQSLKEIICEKDFNKLFDYYSEYETFKKDNRQVLGILQ